VGVAEEQDILDAQDGGSRALLGLAKLHKLVEILVWIVAAGGAVGHDAVGDLGTLVGPAGRAPRERELGVVWVCEDGKNAHWWAVCVCHKLRLPVDFLGAARSRCSTAPNCSTA